MASRTAPLSLALVVALAATTAVTVARTPAPSIEQIRKELLQLPYYGVFDFLAFSTDQGTVTLVGYAYQPSLKSNAEREVKKVAGVSAVVDKIEVLPVSPEDDRIRWATFRAIYRDPALSRYAPGGGWVPHGRMWSFGRPFSPFDARTPFPGMEPLSDYPIHIIVKSGRTTLFGVVDFEMDRTIATARARQVSGTFGVDDQLTVEGATVKSTR